MAWVDCRGESSAESGVRMAKSKNSRGSGFHWHESADDTDLTEFLIPLRDELVGGQLNQGIELVGQCLGNPVTHGSGFTMRAAQRFRNHFIDDAESDQILGGHFQRGCGIRDL